MPAIRSLSEFNRNQNALIEELADTCEPLYLTRNGAACVVVMDASAFDEAMSFRNELFEQELRTYRSLMRGYADVLDGNTVNATEADREIRRAKGWS